ncbi:MFS transporter [Candidatus Tisiphia endosymbiont of Stenodema calcarata]|uniref:MFS transporter n=1 Tax=Candidatus Tisiphia endosymbiont of Stenodema calcarata TaxID=3139337 RepID=UPI003CCB5AF8
MSKIVQADNKIMQKQTSLTKEQKEVVGLLSIGTFLEYFDLMLYVHMAVLLNELFFPKTDPHTATLLSAAAFCSTYLLRPFGALIFGWIGDNVGRKASVVITTFLMAISCFVMANLPTFAQIGIAAAWLVTICRIVQGMTSMGEITGAQLYLTEYLQPPGRYVSVATIVFCAAFGGFAALGVASLVISYALNWRLAFWFGAGVALVGMIARTTLRETPEFADAKRRLNRTFYQLKYVGSNINVERAMQDTLNIQEKINWKTAISLLLVDCIWSVIFYFTYIHCANILKYSFHYTAEQIIHNNFIVSAMLLGNMVFVLYFTSKHHPLVILKTRLILVSIYFLVIPYLLNNATTGFDILIIQSLLLFVACEVSPANAIFFKHFPVFKRFTYTSAIYAASRALVYVITSVSLVYLTDYFSHWGLYFITIPTVVGCAYGLSHFIKLEKDAGNLSEKKTYLDSVTNIA